MAPVQRYETVLKNQNLKKTFTLKVQFNKQNFITNTKNLHILLIVVISSSYCMCKTFKCEIAFPFGKKIEN